MFESYQGPEGQGKDGLWTQVKTLKISNPSMPACYLSQLVCSCFLLSHICMDTHIHTHSHTPHTYWVPSHIVYNSFCQWIILDNLVRHSCTQSWGFFILKKNIYIYIYIFIILIGYNAKALLDIHHC